MGFVSFDVAREVADRLRRLLRERVGTCVVGVFPWCESVERCVIRVLVEDEDCLRRVVSVLGGEVRDGVGVCLFEGVKVIVVVSRVGILR